MDVLAAGIAAGALTLAAWGAWRPHYRAASYLVAGAVELALIGLLVVTGANIDGHLGGLPCGAGRSVGGGQPPQS
ncbi:membrane protein [Mycobacterium tuberculosis TKK_02_0018]|nr:membrane protein [Mycobacterium tuberculosis TKK_02_0018]